MKIEIKEFDKPLIIEFYQSKLLSNKADIDRLNKECREIEDTINRLKANDDISNDAEVNQNLGFNKSVSIKEKILFVLKESSSGELPTRLITDRLQILDPELSGDRSKMLKNVSTILSINNNKVFERREENGENIYRIKK